MALPAARLRDLSACPAHGAGLVAQGADSVQANNQPLARASDQCACAAGPADTITTGSATVRANDRPAARVGSKTVHGGNVMTGSANVWVGVINDSGIGKCGMRVPASKFDAARKETDGKQKGIMVPEEPVY
jgi:uncharacterized Zn-binding protein involved in type VI secretion